MKKLFLTFTLLAAIATGFMSCSNTTNKTLKFASSGEATVSRNGDIYTIDMTGLSIDGISGSPTMHYVGNMPNFDFPFAEE